MDADFWHKKWQTGDIGFHTEQANPLLTQHFAALGLQPGQRVFVPLCGKTRDIHWLLAQGLQVVAAELSEIAIIDLFKDLGLLANRSQSGTLINYQAQALSVFVGDIFQLQASQAGPCDAIYDRAALVALPPDVRSRYAAHLRTLCPKARQLLIAHEYQQELMAGPPFAIAPEIVAELYQDGYDLHLLARVDIAGGFKGKIPASEAVWHLVPRRELI